MKILVAVDDTRAAEAALEWACEILRDEDDSSTAEVFTVWHPEEALGVDGYGLILDGDYPVRSETLLAQLLEEVGSPARVQPVVGSGRPHESILREATGCDLIVMGTRGGGPARQALLGSLSQSIVSDARVPVVIVPESLPDPGGLTVVGWDGSAGARAALDWAVAHRDSTKVTVLHVLDASDSEDRSSTLDRLRAEVAETRSDLVATVAFELVDGDAAIALTSSIPAAAEVVVGQRATFGPSGSIWGSVTSHVISQSPRPVIVVPPEQPRA